MGGAVVVAAAVVAIGVLSGPGALVGSLFGLAYLLFVVGAVARVLWYAWTGRRLRASADDGPTPSAGASWMGRAEARPDGLLLPGTPRRHACDLTLTPRGAVLTAGWTAATLPWEHHRVSRFGIDDDVWGGGPSPTTGWSVVPWGGGDSAAGTRDLGIEAPEVRAVARQRYLVEPWPFSALLSPSLDHPGPPPA